MPRRKPQTVESTWTPNQVVAGNLTRLRHRRNLTQGEVARLLSAVAGKEWTEAMVAHAERSVTGNRVREFTADDLVTLARAFDVPVLYFLTPPPTGIFVHVPGSRIDTMTMLEAVLGRPDNLSEWETLLDEWNFAPDEELPFPLSQQRRQRIRAVAGEIALIRAHHLIRKHFQGNLMELRATLQSLADLALDIEKHEALADLDEDEQIRRIEAMRADIAKGNRIAEANEQFFEESVAAHEQAEQKPARKKDQSP
jgi:transcriptional regulator with XRE-family HTH domain